MLHLGFTIQPGERVHTILRRHWFVLLSLCLKFIFILAIVIGGGWFLTRQQILQNQDLASLFPVGASLFLLFWWLGLFAALADYFLDVWIVTDHRILDIRHTGLFNRTSSELRLSKIQDVSIKIRGFFPTFLDFGSIAIQTAGEEGAFRFEEVGHPEEIKTWILNAYDSYTKDHSDGKEPHQFH